MSRSLLTLIVLIAASSPCFAQARKDAAPVIRSATKARDIGGFALGMDIREAARLAPTQRIGNGAYEAVKDGICYDFGVTRLGHIYRVDSEQDLGRFIIDDRFLSALRGKLAAKYGAPVATSSDSFKWSLVEPVKRTGNQVLPFETNWASAYVISDLDGVTLHVKLLDFRIMWQDEATLNSGPSDLAGHRLAF